VINGRWTSWFGGRAEQETNDAYVRADMTPLSTRISGTVRKMKVNDFDSVKASQVLVEIDDEYRAIVEEAKAALEDNQAVSLFEANLGLSLARGELKCAMGEIPR
jgi:membrane fusion protein, multidrug efflux system